MMPVRLEPAALRSRVKHSTTEPLRSLTDGRIHWNTKGWKTQYDLFVSFVVLRPKSTAMVIVGHTVHLTSLFPGQA